jgi:hypothetical protein
VSGLARFCAAVALTAVFAGACGGGGPPARPATNAELQIVNPMPNEVTGPDVHIEFRLVGATVVPAAVVKGPLRGDQGHIHVSLDGKLVSMAYGLVQELNGLTPGTHLLQGEFVAVDHLPFRNRVRTGLVFRVSA